MRKYKIKTRWIDGTHEDIIEAEDVGKALDKLAKKIDYPSLELSGITESITIWNPLAKDWVSHKSWQDEEKELYDWEKKTIGRSTSKDEWERKIKKVTKLDPGTRIKWNTPPVKEAMYALNQMKVVHGHTPLETHGRAGIRFINTFPPGTDKWNKNYEYRLFLKDAILREETTLYPERVLDDHGWMSVEAYAIDDTGVDEDAEVEYFRKVSDTMV